MEQRQCWMWAKRKYSMTSNISSTAKPSYDDSWEEQAFAEDASGAMGGCTWPPRSYSCSFCRREFRSAQALGGHMNVHRRDRARLKQPSSPPNEILYPDLETPHQNPVQNPYFTSNLGYLYPRSVCGLAYNTNPNSDPAVPPSSFSPSPSKALAPTINENCSAESLIQPFSSSIPQRHHKASPVCSSKSWSNLAEDRTLHKFDIDPESMNDKVSKTADSGCSSKVDNDKNDVAVSLKNLVVCRAAVPSVEFETNKEAAISCKRRRTDASSISFFPKSSSIDRHNLQSQMFDISPSSIEELDLELRLGQRPKV